MAIITISRGSFSKGKEVAEKVARQLGYQSVSREVILEAATDFQIPQNRLDQAIHNAPSIFERFTYEKQKYIAYVAAQILRHFKQDNVVYHGLAGHFFAPNISHLLKVRIIVNFEARVQSMREKENLSREQAIAFLEKDDRDRKNWSYQLYGVDTSDINLYDLVVHIDKLTIDNAVDLICEAARQPQFKATTQSQQAVEDLALAAKTRASLIEEYPTCTVTCEAGTVSITVKASVDMDTRLSDIIKEKAMKVPGVTSVSVRLRLAGLFT
jgi:cytidylate kinase